MAGANTFPQVLQASSISDMTSVPVSQYQDGTICWVDDQQTAYVLSRKSGLVPDGSTIVAPMAQAVAGASSALWFVPSALPSPFSPFAIIFPLGGGADDAPQMSAAYNANAGIRPVILGSGHYLWKSPRQLPQNGLTVVAMPGVTIESQIAPDPTELSSPFNYNKDNIRADITIVTVQPPVGTRVISVVDASDPLLAPESFVWVGYDVHEVRLATYQVKSRDLGANTITVDRPIRQIFPAGTRVRTTEPLQNFRLYGNGLVITGFGFKAVDIVDGWQCYACDLVIDGTGFTSVGFDWNEGCYACGAERIVVNGNGGPQFGLDLEDNEACWFRDSIGNGVQFAAVAVEDCVDAVIDSCSGYNSALHGCLLAVADPTELVENCLGTRIVNSTFTGNLGNGIMITGGSSDTFIDNCEASYNGNNGLYQTFLENTAPNASALVGALVCRGNGGYAVRYDDGSVGNEIASLTSENNAGAVFVSLGSQVRIADLEVTSPGAVPLDADGAGSEIVVDGGHIIDTAGQPVPMVRSGNGARIALRDVTITGGGAGTAVAFQTLGAGFLDLLGTTRLVGPFFEALNVNNVGDVIRIDPTVDLGTTATPFGFAAVGQVQMQNPSALSEIAMPDSSLTLTYLQYHAQALVFSGALSEDRIVTMPLVSSLWRVKNDTARVLTFRGASGAGADVPATTSASIMFDGTDYISM